MTPERLAEIVANAEGKGNILRTVDEGVREQAAHDPKAEAKAETDEYIGTIHGKRAGAPELRRIAAEILHEHEARHRADMERALGLLDHAHSQELPVLEALVLECQAPETAAERHARLVNRGSPDTNLILELVEGVSRNAIRRELGPLPPSAVLPLYRQALSANGTNHHRIVRDSVLIEEVERRGEWHYDPKGPDGAKEHAASLELAKLIAETKASRVPPQLRAVLEQAREARRFADRLRFTLKLRAMTPAELFGDEGVDKRYETHPAIQRAMKRRGEGA